MNQPRKDTLTVIDNSKIDEINSIEEISNDFTILSKRLNSEWNLEIKIKFDWKIWIIYAKWIKKKNEDSLYILVWWEKIAIPNTSDISKKIIVVYLQESANSDLYVNSHLRINSINSQYRTLVENLIRSV